jgi:hypothetical protein
MSSVRQTGFVERKSELKAIERIGWAISFPLGALWGLLGMVWAFWNGYVWALLLSWNPWTPFSPV